MIDYLYHYNTEVVEVYDGDTITVNIDLGLGIHLLKEKIRLYGINAPEVRGEEKQRGLKSRDWLRSKILGKKVILRTVKDVKGKYGRLLGIVYLGNECINNSIVKEGFAEVKIY